MPHEQVMHPVANTHTELDPELFGPEAIGDLVQQVAQDIQHRQGWENKLTHWYRRRVGIKKPKDYPWPGCSNINIPIPDKLIRRQKPMYLSARFGPKPIVTFEPVGEGDTDRSERMEWFYHWLVHKHMGPKRALIPCVHNIDAMCTYSKAHLKVTWDHQTERQTRRVDTHRILPANFDRKALGDIELIQFAREQLGLDPEMDEEQIKKAIGQFKSGERYIDVVVQHIRYSGPLWTFVDTRDLIVPWDSSHDIDALPRLVHRMFKTENQLLQDIESGMIDRPVGEKLLDMGTNPANRLKHTGFSQTLEQTKRRREGIFEIPSESTLYEVWEAYTWKDINGDNIPERCVIRLSPVIPDVPLKAIEYPYEHGEWPFATMNYEETEPRWYSPRGIPEMVADLHAEMNAQHNGKLDRMIIQNSLTATVRQSSPAYRSRGKIRWKPNTWIPVQRQDDFEPITWQFADFSYDNEQRILQGLIEEYVGVVDFGISREQKSEARTAREIEEISSVSDEVAGLDITLDQAAMSRVHNQTIRLWLQYGDDDVMVRIPGGPEPYQFNRFDIYKNFDVQPTGTLRNSNAQLRAQQTLNVMQIAASPPYARHARHYDLFKDYVESALDFRAGKRYVQGPGMAETSAQSEQVAEIMWMQLMGQVHPVDRNDDHQMHLAVVQQAMENVEEKDRFLLLGHQALHLIASGEKQLAQQILQATGFQVKETGMKLFIVTPDGKNIA